MDRDDEAAAERAAAVAEVATRLRSRGIAVTGGEQPEDLVDLLSAVERFEAMVEAHGGDLMVDDLKSAEPDDRHFVVLRRAHAEAVRAYIGRIEEATGRLRRHPRLPLAKRVAGAADHTAHCRDRRSTIRATVAATCPVPRHPLPPLQGRRGTGGARFMSNQYRPSCLAAWVNSTKSTGLRT